MNNISTKLSLLLCCTLLVSSCAGYRGQIKLNKLNYPVSMSAFIYGKKGDILLKGDERLKKISNFSFSKLMWSIFYTGISLSDDQIFVNELNRSIENEKGDGMINFKLKNSACFLNYIFLFNLLPFWPGCAHITISGEIIKER